MKKNSKISKAKGVAFLAAAATLTCPFFANAQSITYECNLSGSASGNLSGCAGTSAGGYQTSTLAVSGTGACTGSDYCGVNANAPLSVAPVSAWNVCRWIENTSGKEVFVPIKTSNEWLTFLAKPPTFTTGGGVSMLHCAVPYSVNGAPASTTISPPFAACTSITGNNPNVYGRTGTSLYPYPATPGPAFTCHSGGTSMMSLEQWKAGDVDVTPPGTSSWTNFYQYSPDITLSPSAAVVDMGTPVTLYWSITPNGGAAVSCSVSPGGWGPDSAGNPSSGSSTVILPSTTTYSLTCTQSPSLTSVASTTVTGNPPPCCAGGGGGGGGG